ncbi:MAG: PD-(D/E)XK motif protein [Bacteroidales bacterium]|nr:PD-(D/E)XK motif protein [Bacteroidales bacterium]
MKVSSDALYKEFVKLSPPHNNATNVVAIEGTNHKLGKTTEGYPEFYISSDSKEGHPKSTPMEYLDVCYDTPCTICENGVDRQQSFCVLSLRRTGDSLHIYFITIVLQIIDNLPAIPTSRNLAVEFDSLISIFSPSHKHDENKVKGLWGELLVIEQSCMPEMLIEAWHRNPNEKFDFTHGKDKIEVKSTAGEERKHSFSIGQLNPS